MPRGKHWNPSLIEPCRGCGQREGRPVQSPNGYLCSTCHQDEINYSAAKAEITEALSPILNELLDVWEDNPTMRRDHASLNELFSEGLAQIGAQILLERTARRPRRR